MENQKISFEELPQVTCELLKEVQQLKETLSRFMEQTCSSKQEKTNEMVGIEEACQILGLKKPTLYHKVQKKEIKSYKPLGCKMILFKRSDLMEWIEHNGRNFDMDSIKAQIENCIRHKPKSKMGDY